MALSKHFIDKFVNVTSRAALASSYLVGKKDKIAADKAAVDAMRSELNKINFKGKIVIGEGELDEAPMLYIGETVGSGIDPEFDIAVDPLEGTNFAANGLPGALSVIAITEKSNLFHGKFDPPIGVHQTGGRIAESLQDLCRSPAGPRAPKNRRVAGSKHQLEHRKKCRAAGDPAGTRAAKKNRGESLGRGKGPRPSPTRACAE